MNKLGYARVSTSDQHLDLQLNALKADGCVKIFEDKGISGSNRERPGLEAVLNALQPGDTLVIWKLDRLGRSIHHLLDVTKLLKSRDIGFRSLSDFIDTSSPTGKLVFHILAAIAEFERDLIRERTKAGLDAARRRGKKLGRRRLLTDEDVSFARTLILTGEATIPEAALSFGVDRTTLWRALCRNYG